MEVVKTAEKYNSLLERKEISFSIDHSNGTPSLFNVKKAVASMCGVSEELVYIIKLETLTGTNKTVGKAEIYEKPEAAHLLVPTHIQSRNLSDRGRTKK